MKGLYTIVLLVLSNTFMTFAWYAHLMFKELKWFENLGLISMVLISWCIPLFDDFFQVPANRIGFKENGGAFFVGGTEGSSRGNHFGGIYDLHGCVFQERSP